MVPIDVRRARRETPGCETVMHFNNAGAALMPQPVVDATVGHLLVEAASGGYEAAEVHAGRVDRLYDSAARLLGCQSDEIAFIENATRAWDMAFYGIPFRAGDRILTSVAEYASNFIAFLQMARHRGVEIHVVPNDESGRVDVDAVRDAIDAHVRLIAITHVPTNGGLVNPVEEIGAIAKEAGVLYLVDACQSVGQMPVRVDEVGCDFLSATGRKYLRGPRGTGLLYVRRAALDRVEPPFLDLHAAEWVNHDRYVVRDDARRFETWESNVAGRVGLGVALDYCTEWGIDAIWSRVRGLAESLRDRLAGLPGVSVTDSGRDRCGIVTFTVSGLGASDVKRALRARGINVSVSERSSTLLDMQARQLDEIVRASVHYYNHEDEIDSLVVAVGELAVS